MDTSWRQPAIDAYLDALTGMLAVAEGLTEEQWSLPTDLVGWNVQDNVAHVNAIEDELAGRPLPAMSAPWDSVPHVTSPFQQYTEVGVQHRRGWSPSEVRDELCRLVPERTAQLSMVPDDPDAEVRGPMGMSRPVRRGMQIRAFDIWAHEQDVRRAVGQPMRMVGPAAATSMALVGASLPAASSRGAVGRPGTVVRWEIAGSERPLLVIRVDALGKGSEVPGDDHADTPDVTVTCDAENLVLAACGRRPLDLLTFAIDGDRDLGRRVLAELPMTP